MDRTMQHMLAGLLNKGELEAILKTWKWGTRGQAQA